MTDTMEMLDAAPVELPAGAAEIARAIDACLNCLQTCISCSDSDLVEEDVGELSTCIALCVRCADVCDLTARTLSRTAHWDPFVVQRVLQACVRTCTASAEECHRHAPHHRHCAICEGACRACIEACSALLGAEIFTELEKPAGV
jgi:hypothetical protein